MEPVVCEYPLSSKRSGSALHPAAPTPISATASTRAQIHERGNPDPDDMALLTDTHKRSVELTAGA
jgi:hypothetical protein